ncbi:MAG: AcrR family transcriptional regulator [Halocynthiibacter sp.]|jgi:AcrR family transcriptional regulator
MSTPKSTPAKPRKSQWKQDPDAVRADILKVAASEFAKNGFSGARVDDIAAKTRASKRMIYYYFTDKDGLYLAVLEAEYARVRQGEADLQLEGLDPISALRRLVEFTFENHYNMPEFIRLVMTENIHNASHLQRSETIPKLNHAAIEKLENVCARGRAEGIFRQDIDALQLHWIISSLSFFNVSNRATFSYSFGPSLQTPEGQAALRERAIDMVLRATVADPSLIETAA